MGWVIAGMARKKVPGDNVTPLRPPSRKGIPATDKQKESLARGRKKKADMFAAGPQHEESRWKMLCEGKITVQDLDDQELSRMQTRDRFGGFQGRPPEVPRSLQKQMKAESVRRGQAIIDAHIGKAIKFLTEVLDSPNARAQDKLKAADMLMSRGMGSIPQHVISHEGTKWDEMLDEADDPVVVYDDNAGAV